MNIYTPEENNPLLLPELVSTVLAWVAAFLLIFAVLGAIHWLN